MFDDVVKLSKLPWPLDTQAKGMRQRNFRLYITSGLGPHITGLNDSTNICSTLEGGGRLNGISHSLSKMSL